MKKCEYFTSWIQLIRDSLDHFIGDIKELRILNAHEQRILNNLNFEPVACLKNNKF
jgi:hypothetical protein